MLKIRLKRVGRKHDPSFRVILVDSHKGPQTGKVIEILGFYDARKDIREFKGEEIKKWISQGAQVSDTVHNLLITEKIIEGKKINVLPKKTPVIKETEEKETSIEEAPVESTSESAKGRDASSDDSAKKEVLTEETPKEETPKEEVAKEKEKEETPAETEIPEEPKEE